MIEHGHYMEYPHRPEIIFSAGPDDLLIRQQKLSFITNLDSIDKDLYEHVVRVYHSTIDTDAIFFISKYATDIYGKKLNGHYSLWGRNCNRTHFTAIWKRFKDDYKDRGFIKRNEFCVA